MGPPLAATQSQGSCCYTMPPPPRVHQMLCTTGGVQCNVVTERMMPLSWCLALDTKGCVQHALRPHMTRRTRIRTRCTKPAHRFAAATGEVMRGAPSASAALTPCIPCAMIHRVHGTHRTLCYESANLQPIEPYTRCRQSQHGMFTLLMAEPSLHARHQLRQPAGSDRGSCHYAQGGGGGQSNQAKRSHSQKGVG